MTGCPQTRYLADMLALLPSTKALPPRKRLKLVLSRYWPRCKYSRSAAPLDSSNATSTAGGTGEDSPNCFALTCFCWSAGGAIPTNHRAIGPQSDRVRAPALDHDPRVRISNSRIANLVWRKLRRLTGRPKNTDNASRSNWLQLANIAPTKDTPETRPETHPKLKMRSLPARSRKVTLSK